MTNTLKYTLLFCCLSIFTLLKGQSGLVAHWSFDTILNNKFIDHITQEVSGTLYGVQPTNGPVGKALYFDGVDDYATIPGEGQLPPATISNLNKGSISVWFRVDNIQTDFGIRPIIYYGANAPCDFFDAANKGMIIEAGHSPIHNSSKRLYFTSWKDGCTFPTFCYDSGNSLIEGKWYHYVAVVGDNYNTGYLNGQEMTDRRYNFGTKNMHDFFSDALVHEKLWIGRGYWDEQDMFFKGAIDEIKIFNRPITGEEVMELFNEGSVLSTIETEKSIEHVARVYPNPGDGHIRIDFVEPNDNVMILKVFNVYGEMVSQSNIPAFSKTISINLRDLSFGIYFYSLSSDNQVLKSDKLIIL